MKIARFGCALALLGVLASMTAWAQESAGEVGLLKRAAQVDDPIPETYEPLNSTYVGDGERLNDTIEQSWQLKKEAKARTQATTTVQDSAERRALEQRIQEPGSLPRVSSEPEVRNTGKGLEIKGD